MNTLRGKIKLSFDRSFSNSWRKQLLWLAGTALLLILVGWSILIVMRGSAGPSLWKTVAYFFDTNSLHKDIDTGMKVPAMFSVVFSFAGMALMSGALISVIVNILTQRVGDFREGHIRYGFRDHIVILGSGDILINMIRHFRSDERLSRSDIVILTSCGVPPLRDRLRLCLPKEDMSKITFLYGRRDSARELKNIRISRAAAVYITGEENEPDHDTANIHSLELIRDICAANGNKTPLACHVMFEYRPSLLVMQYAGYNKALTEKDGQRVLNLHAADLYENRAQNVLVSGNSSGIVYRPLDRGGITEDSDRYVHLVVFGMGRMGCALAETAAHIAHYPNFRKGIKTLITFVAQDARRGMDLFTASHETLFGLSDYSLVRFEGTEAVRENHAPHGGKGFLDVDWEFVEGGPEHPGVRRMIALWSEDPRRILTLAVCCDSPPANISAALHMPQQVYDAKIPVLVYQPGDSALIDIARLSGKYSELRPFGMLSGSFDPAVDERVKTAQRIMYVYDHYFSTGTQARSLPPDEELSAAWNGASLPIQWSNMYMANTIPSKYRSLGLNADDDTHEFTDDEAAMMSRVEHQRWNMEKLLLGYRPVTAVEEAAIEADPSLKKMFKENYFAHYDIRPFDDLRCDHTGRNASEYDRCIIEGLGMVAAARIRAARSLDQTDNGPQLGETRAAVDEWRRNRTLRAVDD